MLTILGFSMMAVFLYLIMSKRLSAINALIIVPVVFALLGGFTDLGPMMLKGVETIAPTAVMVTFAILYFGILIDAGMFDPLVNKMVKLAKGDPLKITIATAVLSLMVGLDGDGTITYLIVVTAFLPIYERLGMNKLILACLPAMAMGIMNLLPWGGPTARLMTIFKYDAMELLQPLIPSIVIGTLYVIGLGVFFGLKERKRLGIINIEPGSYQEIAAASLEMSSENLRRPKLFWFNVVVTLLLVITLLTNTLPLPALFMIGFVIVSIANYPKLKDQKERIEAHAGNILTV
ncbi:citrate:proton symporter, partial [Priestia megaterium]|uniref:citrate:proton symporter n=1 Tax=Priestia megaterium TaxID=1404 RepID=UPI003000E7D8